MKKTIVLTMALAAIVSVASAQTNDAGPVNLDTLERPRASANLLQQNYLNALRLRYQRVQRNAERGADFNNSFRQRASIEAAQKAANVQPRNTSTLTRTGPMQEGRERIQTKTPYQVQAVNSKSIFLKRAMDYYVYDGNAGTDIMSEGNIDMENHKVSRTRMLDMMRQHRKSFSDVTADKRTLQKNMSATSNENSVKRTFTNRNGDFSANMISPFTSLRFLEQ